MKSRHATGSEAVAHEVGALADATSTGAWLWPQRHPVLAACALYGAFVLLTFVLYRGLWATLYYKDDYHWLSIADEVARAPWRLIVAEPQNAAAGVRPVQRALFGLLYTFFGIYAGAYHVASMLLHALNATLVFSVLRRLLGDVDGLGSARRLTLAGFGAFVFASTSLHAAAVVWIAAMSTLMVTGATLVLFRYILAFENRLQRPAVLLGAVLLFVWALLCKNTAVAFPLVLALYLFVCSPTRRWGGGRGRLVLVCAVLGIGWVLLTKLWVGGLQLGSAFGEDGAYALGTNVPLNVLGAFMATIVAPRTYEWLLPGVAYPYVALPLLLATLAVLRGLPDARSALLGLGWVLLSALPTALFDYRQYSAEQIMVSRYAYLPLVGGCIVLVLLVQGLFGGRRATRFFGAFVVLAAASHVAFHARVLRGVIDDQQAYGRSRKLLYDSTLDALRERASPGSEVFALGWPVPEIYLPNIGQHFFAPHGLKLRGPREYEALYAQPPEDEVKRFVAYWDARSTVLTVRPARLPTARE